MDSMVDTFTKYTNEALDEVAPFKTFKIKSQYKFGLSEDTKKLICKRDKTRSAISKAESSEKPILIKKYKKLRNLINSNIRKESKAYNNARVEKAKDENEIWKVVNDVINPNKENNDHLQILSSYSELIDYLQIFSLQCPVPSIQIQTHTSPGERQTATGQPPAGGQFNDLSRSRIIFILLGALFFGYFVREKHCFIVALDG